MRILFIQLTQCTLPYIEGGQHLLFIVALSIPLCAVAQLARSRCSVIS